MRLVPADDPAELVRALRSALDGGPAIAPVVPGQPVDDLAPAEPVEPGTALVVRTSGSTGTPRGVLLSAAALRASAAATHARLGGPGRWLLVLPAQHIAGAQVLARSILAGREPVVGRGPFAEAAAPALADGGPRYTSLVPTQLTRLLAAGGRDLAALQAFDAVLVGGAALADTTLDRAREAGVAVVTTYGMSETAGGCVYDGTPLDGVRVALRDDVIHLGGPTLAHGYRLDPEATAAAFAGGWFRTSDLGTWENGLLRVLGRADDMINTGGVKIAPAAVERVLTRQPGVTEVCVVGVPDPEWGQRIAAAVVGAADAAALAAVRRELGPAAVPKEVRVVPALPLRGPGKVDRRAVAALFGP